LLKWSKVAKVVNATSDEGFIVSYCIEYLCYIRFLVSVFVITARSELHKVLFLALSVTFLCMKYLRKRWTDLRQIHT